MPAADFIVHALFAVLVAMVIVTDSTMGRALWAVPLILVFQIGWLMSKLKNPRKDVEKLKIAKKTLKK